MGTIKERLEMKEAAEAAEEVITPTAGPDENKAPDPLEDIEFFKVEKASLAALQEALEFISNKAEKKIMETTINSVLTPVRVEEK